MPSPLQAAMLARVPFIDLATQKNRIARELDQAIGRVIEHGQFILGPEVRSIEDALASFCGAPHVLSCANGTDALTLVLMAEDIGPGDAVFVPAFTFVATAEAVAERRATPWFVDVEAGSFNMDVASLERAIEAARKAGERPRMVIAVDLFGRPADYPALRRVAERHGLVLVADAAQSFGATLGGKAVGTLADYTTISFFPAKPLGCFGDGGAVATASEDASARIRSLRVHGEGRDRYDNVRIGVNSRLDTIQAAILLEKLRIFPDEIARRNEAAERYGARLASLVKTPEVSPSFRSVWAQYTVLLPEQASRDDIRAQCDATGIPTMVYYPIPLHRQTGYAEFPCDPEGLPVSEMLSERVVSLPMHPYLDAATQTRICDALEAALGG